MLTPEPMNLRTLPLGLLVALTPLTAHAQLTYPAKVAGDAGTTSALVHAGYLDATLYGADPTGTKDSTAAIQNAINDGMNYAMVTYLPSGTYLVSAPLVGEQVFTNECYPSTYWGKASVWQAPTLVGPASGARPVIQLKDASAAFQDATNPVAVVHFYNNGAPGHAPAWSGATDCEMFSVIRDLNVVVGSGNPGAVGIENPGSQGCYLENIHVDATGGYAGIMGTPGVAEMSANLEVDGGQYGIIPYWPTTMVGVTVKNQTVAGLKLDNFASLAVVGFEIDEPAGTAAIVNTFYTSQRSQVALIDGTITIAGASASTSAAIQNPNGHDLYIENVFVASAGPVIQSGSEAAIAGAGSVTDIAKYAFTNPTQDNESGEIENSMTLINGVLALGTASSEVKSLTAATSAPSDLVLRHLPGPLPWMSDDNVVDVTTMGADPTGTNDSTAAIQQAINLGGAVFLPRGMYLISATLMLKPETRLFGVPGSYSQLHAAPSWDPGGKYVPFIQTASTTTGATYVGDLFLDIPDVTMAQSYLYGLEWQAGRSSIVHQVYPRLPWRDCSAGCFTEPARDMVHVTGNGGGRFYGLQLSQIDGGDQDPAMREILVEGTTAPLTFYTPNPEHTSGPMVEFQGASNVRIIGTKVEGQYGLIQASTNVQVTAYAGHNTAGPGSAEWSVVGSSNVLIAASSDFAGGLGTSAPGYLVSAPTANNAGAQGIPDNDNCSLFEQGTFDESPFPHCGDSVCDGAETATSCPADCTAPTGTDGGAASPDAHAGVDGSVATGGHLDGAPPSNKPGGSSTTTSSLGPQDGDGTGDAASGGTSGGCAVAAPGSDGTSDAWAVALLVLWSVAVGAGRRRARAA